MKVVVNIEKKYAYLIIGLIVLFGCVFVVNALNDFSGPSGVGHSSAELDVDELCNVVTGHGCGEDKVGLTSVSWDNVNLKPSCQVFTGSQDLCDSVDSYNSAFDTEAEIDAAIANNGYLTSAAKLTEAEVDGYADNNGYLKSVSWDTVTGKPAGLTSVTTLVNTNTGRKSCPGSMAVRIDDNTFKDPSECIYFASCSVGDWGAYPPGSNLARTLLCQATITNQVTGTGIHPGSTGSGKGVYAIYSWDASSSNTNDCVIHYNAMKIC
ncbi:hypothetical protein GOV13_03370 [Candidatus Pacearchaeota archaeon]|nr:hypothetical protein [Candidatus Pacearchaeota archaeon]